MIVPVVFLAVSVFTVMVLLFISPATCSVGLVSHPALVGGCRRLHSPPLTLPLTPLLLISLF